jgi:hypothetical protein
VFEAAVRKYANGAAPGPVTPPTFQHPPVDQMIAEIWDQLRGPEGKGWPQDKNRTPVETLWGLAKKADL